MARTITILGATGSIGTSTLDLVRRDKSAFQIVALTAATKVAELAGLALEFNAEFAVIADESKLDQLRSLLAGSNVRAAAGASALVDAAQMDADWVMAAIVGAAGLSPTLAAVRRGVTIALANKECLVSAGDLFMREVTKYGATLLPVDSEHNAIYQVFDFERPSGVSKIILTASGGPFRETPMEELKEVTPAQAVAHPNWDMGAKISVDSATMMNKGLEMIEAWHLFPITPDQIDVLVHPQSVVHSMVEYCDSSVLAQMGTPDMRTPIAYALAWPDRMDCPSERLSLSDITSLTFEKPDVERFPCLSLARAAMQEGGAAPTILNAANEMAVDAFLTGKISYMDISGMVDRALEAIERRSIASLEDVLEIDTYTRQVVAGYWRD